MQASSKKKKDNLAMMILLYKKIVDRNKAMSVIYMLFDF